MLELGWHEALGRRSHPHHLRAHHTIFTHTDHPVARERLWALQRGQVALGVLALVGGCGDGPDRHAAFGGWECAVPCNIKKRGGDNQAGPGDKAAAGVLLQS